MSDPLVDVSFDSGVQISIWLIPILLVSLCSNIYCVMRVLSDMIDRDVDSDYSGDYSKKVAHALKECWDERIG